jgi:hypothetical protein
VVRGHSKSTHIVFLRSLGFLYPVTPASATGVRGTLLYLFLCKSNLLGAKKEKETQDYILLIMNCKKYKNKAMQQKKTWLAELPPFLSLSYYHVIGVPEMEVPFLFNDNEHLLCVKAPDDYNSLPKKVIQAYEALESRFKYKYIFKTDDDQMLMDPGFFNGLKNDIEKSLLLSLEQQYHYGGYHVNVKKAHYSDYHKVHPELPKNLIIQPGDYCNGRFYFLSKYAVRDLLFKKTLIQKEYFEDYAIGFHLSHFWKKTTMIMDTNKIFKDF